MKSHPKGSASACAMATPQTRSVLYPKRRCSGTEQHQSFHLAHQEPKDRLCPQNSSLKRCSLIPRCPVGHIRTQLALL